MMMIRTIIILSAILLMSPLTMAAQERIASQADSASVPGDFDGRPIGDRGIVVIATDPDNFWNPNSQPRAMSAKFQEADTNQTEPPKPEVEKPQNPETEQPRELNGEEQEPEAETDSTDEAATSAVDSQAGGTYEGYVGNSGYDVFGKPLFGPEHALRFGWWAVDSEGSPVKVGEYQDLTSSPFWDLDGIRSDGFRTLDYTFSGLDQEANFARTYFYGGPRFSADFDYVRYLHRLDHEPLAAFDLGTGTPGPTDKVVGEDLNVGEDYAIRVQQLDTTVKGEITNNLRWRVDVWGMRKSGERQANAMAHCFNINPPGSAANYTCHVLSQRQSIDWTTIEVKPVLEAKFGNAIVEYSRTMRSFGQNDQLVDRTYTAFDFSPTFGVEGPPYTYGFVSENYTQIDRIKISKPLDEANQLYANLYIGNTENKFRDTNRGFSGYDLRLINRGIENVTWTAYAKVDAQNNELPTDFLTTPPLGTGTGPVGTFEPSSLRHPVEYNNSRFGIKGSWKPPSQSRLTIVSGYEYSELARDFADFTTPTGTYTQEDTRANRINFGPQLRVTENLDAFVRYKGIFINNPLLAVGVLDGNFNTNQPEQVHGVEIGGTWNPRSNLVATAMFGIENSWNNTSDVGVDFDEDNYPIVLTLWYAPTARWSFTGGYAFFSNWIDQDITIGFANNPTERTQWNYDGYNQLVSLNSNFAWSACTQLVGGVEWNGGTNVFSVPPSPAGADWTALPTFSDVVVETTRINVGVDHEFSSNTNAYFRYVYFDFNDLSAGIGTGTTNMFLAGFTMLR
jgi:hypothetical protein